MKRVSFFLACFPFWVLFFLFLTPLLLFRQSFIYGDYAQQHVPWGLETWRAIHAGGLPLWTHKMAGGFPLLAEGQCAALYWTHLIGYRFFSFWIVYTLSIPLHFLIGALGMFVYARKIKLSEQAAVIAATVFCFSSNYAGCFMNTASLRVLCWLPAALWYIESMSPRNPIKAQRISFVMLCVLVCQMWFAGSSQMAFYALGYLLIYQIIAKGWVRSLYLCGAILLGTMMAWPQLGPSLELIAHSARKGTGVGFALTGSVPPVAPISLVYPEWGNRLRYSFYIGIFPLILVCAFLWVRDRSLGRKHLWIGIVFFLLALGKYNPIYKWAVDAFSLTAFRLPSKFLFFTAFSLTILAGFGWDSLTSLLSDSLKKKRFSRFLFLLAGIVVLMPLMAQGLIYLVQDGFPAFRDGYVERLIQEKGATAKAASYYRSTLDQYLIMLKNNFSYRHALNWHAIVLVWSAAVGFWWLAKKKAVGKFTYAVFCLFLIADLAIYGYTMSTGFIGNARPMETRRFTADQERLAQFLQKNPGRFAELVEDPAHELFLPNAAMGAELNQLSGYSPLLLEPYYAWSYPLGVADASLGRIEMSEKTWLSKRNLLDLAGVKYFHTDRALDWDGLEIRDMAEHYFVYENKNASNLADALDASDPDHLTVSLEGVRAETVSLPLMAYPGWALKLDGKDSSWFRGEGGLLTFKVPEGARRADLVYKPGAYPMAWVFSLIGIAMTIFLAYNMARSKER